MLVQENALAFYRHLNSFLKSVALDLTIRRNLSVTPYGVPPPLKRGGYKWKISHISRGRIKGSLKKVVFSG
jgi:hypothetical protein